MLKIDTDRMQDGKELAKKLREGKGGGIPWFVIMDGKGNKLVDSDAPSGNVGCPVTEEEAAWFFEMLDRTKKTLTAEDMTLLKSEHTAFAQRYRR